VSHRQIVLPAALLATVAGAALVPSADAATTTFAPTGAEQTYVVPAGVGTVHVVAVGGHGGGGASAIGFTDLNGNPAQVTADLPVTPGQRLFVQVGGRGGNAQGATPGAGGFNGGGTGGAVGLVTPVQGGGGGGGGGASDVRTVARDQPGTLESRLVVAGGGGGAGGGISGGYGGDAGKSEPGNGLAGAGSDGGLGGAGATPTGPGVNNTLSGALGVGGTGGKAAQGLDAGAGGGGGGGLYGGAGALPGSGDSTSGGGGGAGSVGFAPAAVRTSFARSTDPAASVTISTDEAPAPGTGGPGTTPGTGTPAGPGTTTTGRVVLSGLAASPRRFKAATTGRSLVTTTRKGTGTRLTWSVTAASTTTFEVLAARPGRTVGASCRTPKRSRAVPKRQRCTRFVRVGTFVREDRAGKNTARFTGRVNGRRLAKGAYRLQATPSVDGSRGTTRRIAFTIR